MPAYLPSSCDENVEDADLIGSEVTGAQSVTLAFPGCPSSSTEICLSFDDVHDVNCQNSSPNVSIPKENLNKVISNTCNDLNASKEIENKLEISSKHCLGNVSDVDKVEPVNCAGAVDEAPEQCRTLAHSLPMFACTSSLDAVSTAEVDRDQQLSTLSTSPRRPQHFSSPVQSCSLNWASDRKKVFDGGRDDNMSSCVSVKAKPRGRSLKYKPESRSFEDCICSNAGITSSDPVLHQEFCYSSPPMEYLCGESAHGDSMVTQKSQNTGADSKEEELPKEDASEIKYGDADLDLPALFEQEQARDFQETFPLSSGTSNPHRSPPHFRPKSKDHTVIDRMFVDVLKLLVAADSSDTEIAPGSIFEDAMEFKDRKTVACLNVTSDREQQEAVVASRSDTDCSSRPSSSADHTTSEEGVPDSPSATAMGLSGLSELNRLHSLNDDDDEYECLCCKVKKQYFNEDINNCHYVYEDESDEECSEHWDCLHSESSSGGSSRESLKSIEDANVNEQRTHSSDSRTSRRSSVRELVRSLQEKFSACTNPQPSGKQPSDTPPDRQSTSNDVPGNASISHAASSSHQDNLPGYHSPQTSTSIPLGNMVYSSEMSAQSGHNIKVAQSDKLEKSEHNDKVCFSESSDCSTSIKEGCSFRYVINLKREVKIQKESNGNVPEDVSVLRETNVSSDNDTTLLDEENKTCCPMEQFFQRTDQSDFVSRPGILFASSPVIEERPSSSQGTTVGSYLHSQSSLFSISRSRGTDPNIPDFAHHLRNSSHNPQYEQISPERPHCFEHADPGTSTDIGDKCIHRDKKWSSLLGASTCLNKVKATISRVRSKSVSPLITKLSSVFERMKDVHVHANKSLSLSGTLEESPLDNMHLKASSKRLFENPCMAAAVLQPKGVSSRGSQTTDEYHVQSAHPVHTTSVTTSGDDHPPIFCLEINRTPSVRKSDKQQSRHQQCCIVTRDSKNTDSLNSSQQMERNELTKIQQAVLDTNIDAVKERANHSLLFNKEIPKSFTKQPDIPTSKGRCNDDFLIKSTFLKPGIVAPFTKLKMSSKSPRRSPLLAPLAENSNICEDLRLEDTPVGRPQGSEVAQDAGVESYCIKELSGVLGTQANSPDDPNPFLRPSSTPTNYEREPTGVPLSNCVCRSAPEKSYSWVNASEAARSESRLTEVMAIVSEEVHITRYPSFTDLTNLNSDVSAGLRIAPSEPGDHSFLHHETHNNVAVHHGASETLKLTDQSNDLLLETATIFNTANCADVSNLKDDQLYPNGYPVEMAHNETVVNCVESGLSQNVTGELGRNSQADMYVVVSNTTFGTTDADSGVPKPSQNVEPMPGVENNCWMLNIPKTYTNLSPSINSVDMEQRTTDNVSKDVYALSPPCRSVSDNSSCNDAFGSEEDKPVSGPGTGVIHKTDFLFADLPSPPDDSLSDNSWCNDLLDTETDQSVNDMQVSVADSTLIQSTSRHMCMISTSFVHSCMMSTSPVQDKRLELLRAAVTQEYSPLSEDSLGLTSFGASADSFSSGKKQLLGDCHTKPVIYSQREDSQSSELSMSSLTCTDNPKEPQEDDNLRLYAVDIFRDFRADSEQPSANRNIDTAVKGHESICPGTLALESNATSEGHQDCQFHIQNPAAASEELEAPVGFVQTIAYNVSFENGSDLVENNNEDVITSKLSDLSAAEKQGGCLSEKPCTDSVCAGSSDSLLYDNDKWNVLISRTHPKTIDKVLKTHRDLPSLCTASCGTAGEHDETACSDEAEEKSLNKQTKKIRWLDSHNCVSIIPAVSDNCVSIIPADSDNCVSIIPADSAPRTVFSDSRCSRHSSHADSENTTSQIDTPLDPLADIPLSSSGATKGNASN
ncbi:hypothetical protein BsWGS_21490 [Bradybaena similaris]